MAQVALLANHGLVSVAPADGKLLWKRELTVRYPNIVEGVLDKHLHDVQRNDLPTDVDT